MTARTPVTCIDDPRTDPQRLGEPLSPEWMDRLIRTMRQQRETDDLDSEVIRSVLARYYELRRWCRAMQN